MINMLKAIGQRLKMLLLLDTVSDLETEFLHRQAQRKAELYQQAGVYEENRQPEVAGFLREEADQLSSGQPLSRVLPALNDLRDAAEDVPAELPKPKAITGTGKKKTSRKR